VEGLKIYQELDTTLCAVHWTQQVLQDVHNVDLSMVLNALRSKKILKELGFAVQCFLINNFNKKK
jgi:hypothetical protein